MGPAIMNESMKHKKDVHLFTNNVRFVKGMYTLFERLWQVSLKPHPHYFW
jgi:hypothetical protein